MSPRIIPCSPVTPASREAILAPLLAHLHWTGTSLEGEEMGYALEAPDGTLAGGLLGYWRDGWLFIASVSVPAALRRQGLGRALMTQAEHWVRDHGGAGLWLDTYGLETTAFYRSVGYREMGRLEHYLPGVDRIWLVKRLAGTPGGAAS